MQVFRMGFSFNFKTQCLNTRCFFFLLDVYLINQTKFALDSSRSAIATIVGSEQKCILYKEELFTLYEVCNKVDQAKTKYSCSTLEHLKVSDVRSPLVHPFPIGKYDCPHPFPLFLSKLPHVELIKML